MDRRILDEKKALLSTDYTSQYNQLYVHPEEGETFRFNEAMEDIKSDIDFIDNFIMEKAESLNDVMNATINRLEQINLDIVSEEERLQDVKILCNKFTDFDKVIPINNLNVDGQYDLDNGTFSCKTSKHSKVKIEILGVTGNGLEGNKYVYKDYAFVDNSLDTSERANLIDDSKTSYWEYERISASPKEEYLLSDFHIDSENAVCTITFHSEKEMNLINISTDSDNISVTGVQYSYNGVDYEALPIPEIKINNVMSSYSTDNYICGDSKIVLPFARYVKLTLQVSAVSDDEIAYERVMFEKIPDEEITPDESEDGINGGFIGGTEQAVAPKYNLLTDKVVVVPTAKRRAIKINDLSAYSKEYVSSSYLVSEELVTDGKYYSAAVFANVYLPEELDNDSVEFILTINGQDYHCIPINNKGNGIKVFRFSQGKSKPEYTELISSPIVSLYLTIKMKGDKNYSPYINNVKVLLGGKI